MKPIHDEYEEGERVWEKMEILGWRVCVFLGVYLFWHMIIFAVRRYLLNP